MKENIINIETAKLAKEKGFNIVCDNCFAETLEYTIYDYHHGSSHDEISEYVPPRLLSSDCLGGETIKVYEAPTQTLLQRWLREVHDIDIWINRSFSMNHSYHYEVMKDWDFENIEKQHSEPNRSYEQCLEDALLFGLKLIK